MTTVLDEEDENLANFLESEVLSVSEQEEEVKAKRVRVDEEDKKQSVAKRMETGLLTKIPPELFPHILKFLSSEDLMLCSLVCRFLNYASSDEFLWRRLSGHHLAVEPKLELQCPHKASQLVKILDSSASWNHTNASSSMWKEAMRIFWYCMRWGLLPPTKKLRQCPWKELYIRRDEEDMIELVRNCPPEFKEYYIQMQAAKRSQVPLPSQVNDDRIILDKTVADQVSMWKSSKGLTDKVVTDHACSGETCSYYHIGDVFICEKTGNVHVCDDTCREVVMDPTDELLVCKISGHCFDRLLSAAEMEPDTEQQQGGVTDEAEPFMGSGRFARAYLLGYNCADEKELEAALRFC
uniref:F-box domain-containing protein n=1 Tax=Fagus sylvatica TaxID=28930 RepID=A0A2N9FFB2_FAGSY